MSNWKKILITAVVCLGGGLLAGLLLRGCSKPSNPPEPIVIHDTITVNDTAYIWKHTKPKEIVKWDTCYLPAVDSGHHSVDTNNMVEVQVPITAYEYRDTFNTDTSRIELGVHFSGYKAKIDSLDLNYTFIVNPVVQEKENGWGQFIGVGLSAGYGLGCKDPLRFEPFIGVTITYGWGYHWKSSKRKARKAKIEKYVSEKDSIYQK